VEKAEIVNYRILYKEIRMIKEIDTVGAPFWQLIGALSLRSHPHGYANK